MFENAKKEDRYFYQASNNSFHALTIDLAPRYTKQARLGKPVPREEMYTLRTTKSVQQNMRICISNRPEPVSSKGLLDSESEANLVSQKFIKEMNLPTPKLSNIKKLITIDGRKIPTYGVHLLNFEITDRAGHTQFFKDTFLACDCDNTFILGMPWLSLANPDVYWATAEKNHIQWKKYDAKIALETTRQVELTDADTFAEDASNTANKVYVMHVKHISDPDGFPAKTTLDLKHQDI